MYMCVSQGKFCAVIRATLMIPFCRRMLRIRVPYVGMLRIIQSIAWEISVLLFFNHAPKVTIITELERIQQTGRRFMEKQEAVKQKPELGVPAFLLPCFLEPATSSDWLSAPCAFLPNSVRKCLRTPERQLDIDSRPNMGPVSSKNSSLPSTACDGELPEMPERYFN